MSALTVWFVSPEYAPYVSFGGIGTGLRGLVQALLRRGHRMTIVVPISAAALARGQVIAEIFLDELESTEATRIVVAEADDGGARVLLFGLPAELFIEPGYGSDVAENPAAARRSGLFARSVVEWIVQENQSRNIDVVHAHEWPASMVPYLLQQRLANIPTVFTIHSLAHQGLFPPNSLVHFDLGPEHAQWDRLELYGRISLLKGALISASRITTVSPTYASEIQSPQRGELLDGVLRMRRNVLSGILNGIDMKAWNPVTDSALTARFSIENMAGKRICKQSACASWGLDKNKPLVVSLGRLVEQKGIDWLVAAAPMFLEKGANLVIAGNGDPRLEELVVALAREIPTAVKYLGHVSDEDARRLLAAADLFLMPSHWEPCGVVQLQAMRYGAVPIAHRTGGLADTIIDANERPGFANGYLFDEPSAAGVAQAVIRALEQIGTVQALALQRRGMNAALGWEGPARAYEQVYRSAQP